MRVWVMVLCLVGCADNAGMRPRGLRNSVRIESLERRIATTEGKLGITPERPPPQPRTDLQSTDLDVRMQAMAKRLAAMDARMAAMDERLTKVLAAQFQVQQEVAELRRSATPAPSAPTP